MPWYVKLDRWLRHNHDLYRRVRDLLGLLAAFSLTLHFVGRPPEGATENLLAILVIAGGAMMTLFWTDALRRGVELLSDDWLDKGTRP